MNWLERANLAHKFLFIALYLCLIVFLSSIFITIVSEVIADEINNTLFMIHYFGEFLNKDGDFELKALI